MRVISGFILGLFVGILSVHASWRLSAAIFFVLALVVVARLINED